MSTKYISWAFETEGLKPTEKLVLIKLADSANDLGVCWPHQKTIAKHVGVKRPQVNKVIKSLSDKGLVSVEKRQTRKGARKSNIYILKANYKNEEERQEFLQEHMSAPCSLQEPVRVPVEHTYTSSCGAHVYNEPSIEPSNETLSPKPSFEDPFGFVKSSFNEVWKAYPLSKRGSRTKAMEVWGKIVLGKNPQQVADRYIKAIKLLQQHNIQWIEDNGKYIPSLHNFLDQDGLIELAENYEQEGHTEDEIPF